MDVIILSIIFCILLALLCMSLFNSFWTSQWFCNKMGWHLQPKTIGIDGCSLIGICPRCGERVLQDGQGNWF